MTITRNVVLLGLLLFLFGCEEPSSSKMTCELFLVEIGYRSLYEVVDGPPPNYRADEIAQEIDKQISYLGGNWTGLEFENPEVSWYRHQHGSHLGCFVVPGSKGVSVLIELSDDETESWPLRVEIIPSPSE